MAVSDYKPEQSKFGAKLAEQYDRLRREMSQAILPASPLAFSIDGRSFGYEVPFNRTFRVGSYVKISTPDAVYLGQITAQELATREGPQYGIETAVSAGSLIIAKSNLQSNFVDRVRIRYVQGGGDLIGLVTPDGIRRTGADDAFEDAALDVAPDEMIASYLATDRKHRLDVGYALGAEPGKVRVQLQSTGFRRHTFMCGQSRSGKTFALGVMLEQILLAVDGLRVIILDPNSDFVRLGEIRTKAEHDATLCHPRTDEEYSAIADRYELLSAGIRVLRPEPLSPAGLKIRLSDLDPDEQGAVLQLHPTRDLNTFNAFSTVVERMRGKAYSWQGITENIVSDLRPATLDLVMRLQNLQVADWAVWCRTQEPSISEALRQEDWKCMVIDIGTLPSPDQRAVAAIAVLNYIWKARDANKPVLLVVDEAHNICPHEPTNRLQEIATDYIVRIAGEGLKYGLRLLLVSQRPAKINLSVLTQCENLVLMRMNSRADLEGLTHTFSQVSPTLMAQSRHFVQGESLIAGEITKGPTFVKFEGRLTHEGGGDVRAG